MGLDSAVKLVEMTVGEWVEKWAKLWVEELAI